MITDENRHSKVLVYMAWLSVIPVIGALPSVTSIAIGVTGKKSNSRLIGKLGLTGILSTSIYLVVLLSLPSKINIEGAFNDRAKRDLIFLAGFIEETKVKKGRYPESLEEVRRSLKFPQVMRTYDLSSRKSGDDRSQEFYYKLANEGKNYYLFSVGRDGTPFTKDDLDLAADMKEHDFKGWLSGKQGL